jgi:hypothetical protein
MSAVTAPLPSRMPPAALLLAKVVAKPEVKKQGAGCCVPRSNPLRRPSGLLDVLPSAAVVCCLALAPLLPSPSSACWWQWRRWLVAESSLSGGKKAPSVVNQRHFEHARDRVTPSVSVNDHQQPVPADCIVYFGQEGEYGNYGHTKPTKQRPKASKPPNGVWGQGAEQGRQRR